MVEELRSFLREKLIGQNEAIDEIVNLFVSRAVRTDDDRRPFMSVFLNGTSGVGKTLIFELIHEFLNDHPSIRKSGGRIPITKISLNWVFAFELVETFFWLSSSARNPWDSRRSKFEILYEEATDADPIFGRQIILLDEFDKLGPSINWNEKIAFNSISESFDNAIITPKHPDATQIDLSNTILVITWNYFLNEVNDPRRPIGFSMPDENVSEDVVVAPPQEVDKNLVLEKIRKHFSISSFNRIDRYVLFSSLNNHWDLRRGFSEKEVQKMFDTIDRFYTSRGNPLPDIEQYGKFDTLVQESLDNCEKSGGFRAIKRYIQNVILWRILLKLHGDYPNISPADRERKRRIANRGGEQKEISKDETEFMEAFGMEDMAKVLNNINYE